MHKTRTDHGSYWASLAVWSSIGARPQSHATSGCWSGRPTSYGLINRKTKGKDKRKAIHNPPLSSAKSRATFSARGCWPSQGRSKSPGVTSRLTLMSLPHQHLPDGILRVLLHRQPPVAACPLSVCDRLYPSCLHAACRAMATANFYMIFSYPGPVRRSPPKPHDALLS